MKYDRILLLTLNAFARFFEGLAILVGLVFLAAAYAIQENRITNAAVGLAVCAMGIAFVVTKSVNAKKIAGLRRRSGSTCVFKIPEDG